MYWEKESESKKESEYEKVLPKLLREYFCFGAKGKLFKLEIPSQRRVWQKKNKDYARRNHGICCSTVIEAMTQARNKTKTEKKTENSLTPVSTAFQCLGSIFSVITRSKVICFHRTRKSSVRDKDKGKCKAKCPLNVPTIVQPKDKLIFFLNIPRKSFKIHLILGNI